MEHDLRCACCGKPIDWPPLDYSADAPLEDIGVAADDIASRVHRNNDVCIVDGQTFLIRGNVQIPIIGRRDTLAWGAWCSVSPKSFDRIQELWNSPAQIHEPPFFAWLMTRLPCYAQPTAPVKAQLHLRGPCVAPYIEVWPEHPLGREQVEGITMERVWEFARHIIGDTPPATHGNCSPPGGP